MFTHSLERISELMEQIGGIEDFGMVVAHDERPAWQVIIGEKDAPIMLEFDEERHVITLSSEVGAPADTQVDRINALAIEYAHLYATTGGARVSRSRDDGIYSLIADYGVDTLTRATLGLVLRRFARMSEGWSDIVSGKLDAKPAPDGRLDSSDFFIRA